MSTPLYLVFVTAPDADVGRRLAAAILEARVGACVNIVPGIESHYWWQGKIDQSAEVLLVIKSTKAKLKALQKLVIEKHPYDTPEFVAFGISSVPLWNGESIAPVWDIRQFNKGRSGIVSTPALGQAMAAALGRSEGVLLWGHGIAMTGGTVKDVVGRVIELRDSARLQQATISMGGAWKPQVRKDDPADRNRT